VHVKTAGGFAGSLNFFEHCGHWMTVAAASAMGSLKRFWGGRF
jgi:hypothetical protein